MADQDRPRTCPVVAWCGRGNFPCYCEDAGGQIDPGAVQPQGPSQAKQK